MKSRIFLTLSAAFWLLAGLYGLVNPEGLVAGADLMAHSGAGSAELRAVYGGMSAAIGVLLLLGALRPAQFARHALMMLAFLSVGLIAGRLLGALLAAGFGMYTGAALGLELVFAVGAIWLLRARAPAA